MNPDSDKDKWREGYDAYFDGKQQEDCPYVVGSSDYDSWIDGWVDGITDAGATPYEWL